MAVEKKTKANFRALLATFAPEYPLKNGYVARLIFEGRATTLGSVQQNIIAFVQPLVQDKCIWENSLKANLKKLKNVFEKFYPALTTKWSILLKYCNELFPLKFKDLPTVDTLQPSHPLPSEQVTKSTQTPPPPLQLSISGEPSTSHSSAGLSPKKLRNDCERCADKQRTFWRIHASLRKRLVEQRKKHMLAMKRYSSITGAHKIIRMKESSRQLWKRKYFDLMATSTFGANKAQCLEISLEVLKKENMELAKKLKERDTKIEDLQKQLQEATVANENLTLDNIHIMHNVEELRKEVDNLIQANKQLKKDHVEVRKADKEMIKRMEVDVDTLRQEQEEAANEVLQVKDGNTYNHRMRKCLFKCLLCNVAVDNCGDLIEYLCLHLLGKTLSNVPQKTVVSEMAYEMGVLSDIQIRNALHKSAVTTLGWDATTFEGRYFNEVHILTNTNSFQEALTLNISLLAGGTAEDYCHHVTESLLGVINIYCSCYGLVEEEVKWSILRAIKSTISDKAPVNNCVTRALEERLGMELLDLKCLVHPLDGLANVARTTLAKIDGSTSSGEIENSEIAIVTNEVTRQKKKAECNTSSLLYNISKMRYKQGSGDPGGFYYFLKENHLCLGVISRYVGNRLHVMFHMAATVYHHRVLLLTFFDTICSHKGFARTAIVKQLKNSSTLAQLQALGLYGKIVTGPWMRVLYRNEEKLSNLQVVTAGKISSCMKTLDNILADREYIFICSNDAFGEKLNVTDPVLVSLRTKDSDTVDMLYPVLAALAVAFISKLNLQLKKLIDGELSQPTEEMLENTASAPVNNMEAERTLGMMDALWRRAPNATIGFISGKVQACKNKTLDWLDRLEDEEQARLVYFSVRNGVKSRMKQSMRNKEISELSTKRRKELGKKNEDGRRNKLGKVIKDHISKGAALVTLQEFQGLDRALVARFDSFLQDGISLVGSVVHHTWLVDNSLESYVEIIRALKRKGNAISINYTCYKSEDPENREEHKLPVEQFLADWIFGDLVFLNDS